MDPILSGFVSMFTSVFTMGRSRDKARTTKRELNEYITIARERRNWEKFQDDAYRERWVKAHPYYKKYANADGSAKTWDQYVKGQADAPGKYTNKWAKDFVAGRGSVPKAMRAVLNDQPIELYGGVKFGGPGFDPLNNAEHRDLANELNTALHDISIGKNVDEVKQVLMAGATGAAIAAVGNAVWDKVFQGAQPPVDTQAARELTRQQMAQGGRGLLANVGGAGGTGALPEVLVTAKQTLSQQLLNNVGAGLTGAALQQVQAQIQAAQTMEDLQRIAQQNNLPDPNADTRTGPPMEEVGVTGDPNAVPQNTVQELVPTGTAGVAGGGLTDPNADLSDLQREDLSGEGGGGEGGTPWWQDPKTLAIGAGITDLVKSVTDLLNNPYEDAAKLQADTAQKAIDRWQNFYDTDVKGQLKPFADTALETLETVKKGIAEGKWQVDVPTLDDDPAWTGYKTKMPVFGSVDEEGVFRKGRYEQELTPWGGFKTELPTWTGYKTELPEFDPSTVDVKEDPGYQFRLDEGLKAIRRGAAAGSGVGSGATGKALTRFGQDYASNEYSRAYGRAVGRHEMSRANALEERRAEMDAYRLSMERGLSERAAERISWELMRQHQLDQRSFQERAYEIARQEGLDARAAERYAHELAVQRTRQTNMNRVQTYDMRRGEADRDYGRHMDLLGVGRDAQNLMLGYGRDYHTSVTNLEAMIAAARAAGKIADAEKFSRDLEAIKAAAGELGGLLTGLRPEEDDDDEQDREAQKNLMRPPPRISGLNPYNQPDGSRGPSNNLLPRV